MLRLLAALVEFRRIADGGLIAEQFLQDHGQTLRENHGSQRGLGQVQVVDLEMVTTLRIPEVPDPAPFSG